jgi:hypothetical protein
MLNKYFNSINLDIEILIVFVLVALICDEMHYAEVLIKVGK